MDKPDCKKEQKNLNLQMSALKAAVLQVKGGHTSKKRAAEDFGLAESTLGMYCKKWARLSEEELKNNDRYNYEVKNYDFKNRKCKFDLQLLKKAVLQVKQQRASLKITAKAFGMSLSTLKRYCNMLASSKEESKTKEDHKNVMRNDKPKTGTSKLNLQTSALKSAVLQVKQGKTSKKRAAEDFGLAETTLGFYCRKWARLSVEELKNNDKYNYNVRNKKNTKECKFDLQLLKKAVLQVNRRGGPLTKTARAFGLSHTTLDRYCKKWASLEEEESKVNEEHKNELSIQVIEDCGNCQAPDCDVCAATQPKAKRDSYRKNKLTGNSQEVLIKWDDGFINIVPFDDLQSLGPRWRLHKKKLKVGERFKVLYEQKFYYGEILSINKSEFLKIADQYPPQNVSLILPHNVNYKKKFGPTKTRANNDEVSSEIVPLNEGVGQIKTKNGNDATIDNSSSCKPKKCLSNNLEFAKLSQNDKEFKMASFSDTVDSRTENPEKSQLTVENLKKPDEKIDKNNESLRESAQHPSELEIIYEHIEVESVKLEEVEVDEEIRSFSKNDLVALDDTSSAHSVPSLSGSQVLKKIKSSLSLTSYEKSKDHEGYYFCGNQKISVINPCSVVLEKSIASQMVPKDVYLVKKNVILSVSNSKLENHCVITQHNQVVPLSTTDIHDCELSSASTCHLIPSIEIELNTCNKLENKQSNNKRKSSKAMPNAYSIKSPFENTISALLNTRATKTFINKKFSQLIQSKYHLVDFNQPSTLHTHPQDVNCNQGEFPKDSVNPNQTFIASDSQQNILITSSQESEKLSPLPISLLESDSETTASAQFSSLTESENPCIKNSELDSKPILHLNEFLLCNSQTPESFLRSSGTVVLSDEIVAGNSCTGLSSEFPKPSLTDFCVINEGFISNNETLFAVQQIIENDEVSSERLHEKNISLQLPSVINCLTNNSIEINNVSTVPSTSEPQNVSSGISSLQLDDPSKTLTLSHISSLHENLECSVDNADLNLLQNNTKCSPKEEILHPKTISPLPIQSNDLTSKVNQFKIPGTVCLTLGPSWSTSNTINLSKNNKQTFKVTELDAQANLNMGSMSNYNFQPKKPILAECLDCVPPSIADVFKCENIKNGFNNSDLVFVLSLLPDMDEMTDTQKFYFQTKVIKTLVRIIKNPNLQ